VRYQSTLRQIDTVTHLNAQTNKNADKVYWIGSKNILTFLSLYWQTSEPRGAWKIISETGLFGGNTKQPAQSADRIVAPKTRFEIMRCVLYKIRTFFENNPDAEI
jgi:hypothetical protein